MKRKNNRKKIKKLLEEKKYGLMFWTFMIIAGLIFGIFGTDSGIKEKETVPNLKDFKETEVKIAAGIIFLIDKENPCTVLPVYISLEQSLAIAEGLKNKTIKRPLTHDLMKNVLEELDAEILAVKIVALKEGTYYAELVLKKGDKIIKIDARPSDAIAIALRMKSKVYVNKSLLIEYGENICGEDVPLDYWVDEVNEIL